MKGTRRAISIFAAFLFILTGFMLPIAQPVAHAITEQRAQSGQTVSGVERFAGEDIDLSNVPAIYAPEDTGGENGSVTLFSFFDASGNKHYRVYGRYGDEIGFFACDMYGTVTDPYSGPVSETADRALASLDPNSAEVKAAAELIERAGREQTAITVEEYEKLLAVQLEPSHEYVESLILSREDNGDQHTVEYCLSPVRYRTADGEWQLIDPYITIGGKGGSRSVTSGGSSVRTCFGSAPSGEGLAAMEKDGFAISVSPANEDGSVTKNGYSMCFASDGETKAYEASDTGRAGAKYKSVVYKNAFSDGADLICTPTDMGLKQEIVLYSAPAQSAFRFTFTAGKLIPVLHENGCVSLVDPDTLQIEAQFNTPYMYDPSESEDGVSYDIEVTLAPLGDGKYLMSMTPDEEWLNDESRAYPIVIDTTETYNTASYIGDTYIDQGNGSNNYSDAAKLGSGKYYTGKKRYALFDFTAIINDIPHCRIDGASFSLHNEYGFTAPHVDIGLFQTTAWFDVRTVTWNSGVSFETSSFANGETNVDKTWDITSQVQKWCNDSTLRRKVIVKLNDDNEWSNDPKGLYKDFTSIEGAIVGNRPKLVLQYTTAPNPPASASISYSVNASDSTKFDIKGTWSAVSGATRYTVALFAWNNNAWFGLHEYNVTGTSYTFTKQNDSTKYIIRIWAGNSVGLSNNFKQTNDITTPDRTPPAQPTWVHIDPEGWTNGTITVTHSACWDNSNGTVYYQLAALSTTATPTESQYLAIDKLPNNTGTTHVIQPSGNPSGELYVWIRAVDDSDNKSAPTCATDSSGNKIPYHYCNTAPTIVQFEVEPSDDGLYEFAAFVDSQTANKIKSWSIAIYASENTDGVGYTAYSASNNNGIPEGLLSCTVDTGEFPNNRYYWAKLEVFDLANNRSVKVEKFFKGNGSQEVPAALVWQGMTAGTGSSYNVWTGAYGIADPTDTNTYSDARLVVDNELMEGLSYTIPLESTPEGLVKYAYIMAKDQTGYPVYTLETREKAYAYLDPANLQHMGDDEYVQYLQLDGGIALNGSTVSGTGTLTLYPPVRISEQEDEDLGTISYVDLIVSQTVPQGASIDYTVSFDGGENWRSMTPVSLNGVENGANRLFSFGADVGGRVVVKAQLNKGSASTAPSIGVITTLVRFLPYGCGSIVDLEFMPDARGAVDPENVVIFDNGTNDRGLKLAEGAESGSIKSTTRYLTTDTLGYRLGAEAEIPEGADIRYYLSTNGGADWQEIQPVATDDYFNYYPITAGREVILKAELTASPSGMSPVLRSWCLDMMTEMPGFAQTVQLIDRPDSLSTLVNANNMVLLRWSGSATPGVTYNVYRDTTPYFHPSDDNKVASGIEDCYWYDYDHERSFGSNGNYGLDQPDTFMLENDQTYYYRVCAVKDNRLSFSTNEAFAHTVDADELDKHLGLQSYWTYAQFDTGSGAGYVNVSNGNLVYQSTDLVIPDPFFALVMRRTFNSQAKSKTAMGYGWDFSFNTTLMREKGFKNDVDMILKDGDGSLHRFKLIGEDVYQSAVGTRMTLTHENGEYVITRKDNISYHFDDQTLQLKYFANLSGARLELEYDERGNVEYVRSRVSGTVLNELKLNYAVLAASVDAKGDITYREVDFNESDYLYVNDHVDMLKSIEWTSTEGGAALRWEYIYDNYDRLVAAKTNVQQGLDTRVEYKETYVYENNVLTAIINPDGDHTGVESRNRYDIVTNAQNRCAEIRYASSDIRTPSSIESNIFVYGAGKTTVRAKVGTDAPYDVATYEYASSTGVVKKFTDAAKHTISYTYTSDLLPETVSYKNIVEGVYDSSKSIVQTYSYYPDTRDLASCTAAYGSVLLTEVKYEDYQYNQPGKEMVLRDIGAGGSKTYLTTTYEYDYDGQILTVTDPTGKTCEYTYNAKRLLASEKDRNGAYVFYYYDNMGRVKNVFRSNSVNPLKAFSITDYSYDAYGRTASTSVNGMDDNNDGVVDTTYYSYTSDFRGLLEKVTYANGATEENSYSIAGLLLTSVSADNVVTSYTYDDISRVIETTQYPESDPYNRRSVSYAYNGKDGYGVRNIVVTDPEGRTSTTWYDARGLAVRSLSGGVTTEYKYDMMGRQTAEKIVGKDDTRDFSLMTRVEYDAAGNQTLSALVETNNINCVDKYGCRSAGYNRSMDIETKYTYDKLGNVKTVTDGCGGCTTYTYDELSRLVRVEQLMDKSGTVATTTYAYDIELTNGNIKNVTTDANRNADSAKGSITETVFDKSGRLLSETASGTKGLTTLTFTTAYTYDAKGRTTSVTRNDGSIVCYTYDCVDNLLTEKYYEAGEGEIAKANGSPDMITEYTYNPAGTLVTHVSQSENGVVKSAVDYSYDLFCRVTQQSQQTGPDGEGALTVSYKYNKADQVTGVAYPDDEGTCILWYTYGNSGRLATIHLEHGSFENDGPSANAEPARKYTYQKNGLIRVVTDYTGLEGTDGLFTELEYRYNGLGLTSQFVYYDLQDGVHRNTMESEVFKYDKCGNIVNETHTEHYDGIVCTKKSYEYDLAGRMTKAVTNSAETLYSYDLVGNRMSMTVSDGKGNGQTSSYGYDGLNRLTSITQTNNGATTSYQYDDRGNQTEEKTVTRVSGFSVTTTNTFEYDLADRLVSYVSSYASGATQTEVNNSSYDYNAYGQRVTRVENEAVTHYYYSGSAVLYTTGAGYQLRTQNILTPDGGIIASKRFEGADYEQMFAGEYFFYRYDARGSVTNIVDKDGESVKHYEYDEFGNTTSTGDSFHNDVTFTGSVADSSGLQYMNARYYNPKTARFITQDTYKGNASQPWTQHLYSYCGNNPVNMTDPTGHRPVRGTTSCGGDDSGEDTGETWHGYKVDEIPWYLMDLYWEDQLMQGLFNELSQYEFTLVYGQEGTAEGGIGVHGYAMFAIDSALNYGYAYDGSRVEGGYGVGSNTVHGVFIGLMTDEPQNTEYHGGGVGVLYRVLGGCWCYFENEDEDFAGFYFGPGANFKGYTYDGEGCTKYEIKGNLRDDWNNLTEARIQMRNRVAGAGEAFLDGVFDAGKALGRGISDGWNRLIGN